jgi:hypothetical protein
MKRLIIPIFILFYLIALITLISASWIIPKATTCNFLNVSGSSCDSIWCSIINCEYNSTLEACICDNGIKYIDSINVTNLSDFYNKTQIDAILNTINLSISNISGNLSLNNAEFLVNKTYVDNQIISSKNSVLDYIDKRTGTTSDNSSNSSFFSSDGFYFLIIGVVLIGGYLLYTKKGDGGSQSAYGRGEAPTSYRKIQSNFDLQKDDKIKELEEKLKETERNKAEKSSVKNKSIDEEIAKLKEREEEILKELKKISNKEKKENEIEEDEE